MADAPLSDEELLLLGHELLASWMDDVQSLTIKARHTKHVGIAWGLAAHVHRLAPVILDLLDRELVLEAMPLVRAAYETALTTQWIVQVPNAPLALAAEHVRQRKNLIDTLRSTQSLRHMAERVAVEEPLETGDDTPLVAARNFAELCDDLTPGGPDAYVHYRHMSSMAHPSAFLVDFYCPSLEDSPLGFGLSHNPERPPRLAYAGFTIASMIWAGRAVDYMDRNHRRRETLRQAARRIGITSELHPTASALGLGMK